MRLSLLNQLGGDCFAVPVLYVFFYSFCRFLRSVLRSFTLQNAVVSNSAIDLVCLVQLNTGW